MRIKTNQLDITLDDRRFDQVFDVFRISTSEKHIKRGAFILDAPQLCDRIVSILFKSGKSCLVLLNKADDNRDVLRTVLQASNDDSLLIEAKESVSQVPKADAIQLLLNALGNAEHKLLRFMNLTGHLFCFHPEWIEHGKSASADVIWKIHCLEISITEQERLALTVRTFTSEYLKKSIRFNRLKFDDYPKYVVTSANTLRRKLADDAGPSFIMRQTQGEKIQIPFLDIQNLKTFEASKMGVLYSVLYAFNRKYKGLAKLRFSEIDSDLDITHPRSFYKEDETRITARLNDRRIRIIDQIDDSYSADYCEYIRDLIEAHYRIPVSIGKRISKKAWNICIIHNAAYYSQGEDIYRIFDDAVVQHITLEDFKRHGRYALRTILHDLMIKEDLQKGEICIFDWASLHLQNDVVFGLANSDRYFFMKIHPDGRFDISEQQLDLFNINEFSQYLIIFEDAVSMKKPLRGIVQDDKGNINLIRDTGWFTIPEIEEIHRQLQEGNTKLRNAESRDRYLSAALDIHSFVENDTRYYYVNDIGSGMQTTVRSAANIRQIERYEQSADIFTDLLPTMDVTFVRNGQLTVLPFPFKYLREYIKTVS